MINLILRKIKDSKLDMNVKKKQNICVITTVHHIYDTRIFHKEIKTLLNYGFSIIYIAPKSSINYYHPNLHYYFLKSTKRTLAIRIINIALAFYYALKINATIYHLHDPELLPLGIFLKMFNKKVIYDIHEIHYKEILNKSYLPKSIANIIAISYKLIEKFALTIFDHIILAEKGYLPYYNSWKEKILILQNFYLPINNSKNSKKRQNKNLLDIIYVGSITEDRGIKEFISFAEIVSEKIDANFHIVGPFYPVSLKDHIENLLKKKKIADKIKIYGHLSFPESQNILQNCDIGIIFLYPTENYLTSLPTKLFEYMGNGLTVIMNNLPLLENFNKKYNCGLIIDIFKLQSEKKRIWEFLSNKQTLTKLGEHNKQIAFKHFVWDKEKLKLVQLYKKLTSK